MVLKSYRVFFYLQFINELKTFKQNMSITYSQTIFYYSKAEVFLYKYVVKIN